MGPSIRYLLSLDTVISLSSPLPLLPTIHTISSLYNIIQNSVNMSVVTQPRSVTGQSSSQAASLPSTSSTSNPLTNQSPPRFNNFRPARYQTKEELDRFFGTTHVQKREQRLRVRETDGQVYFDWIEKDEWQHLLATGSLTSPNSPSELEGRRRSSVATLLTLNSPLFPASPARRASLATPRTPGCMSPLASQFDMVNIRFAGEGDSGDAGERRGRKRSNSALQAGRRNGLVEDQLPHSSGSDERRNWINATGFKRRQSDTSVFHPRHSYCDPEELQDSEGNDDRIRISRLPLGHRKLDQDSLDQAFGGHLSSSPLIDLSPKLAARTHKPATLQIPSHRTSSLIEVEGATSPVPSLGVDGCTFDSGASARRGTFGALCPPAQPRPQRVMEPVQVLSIANPNFSRHIRPRSDTAAMTPPSSAAMEFLQSPTPTSTSTTTTFTSQPPAPLRTLRHAVSFDTPRQTAFSIPQNDTVSADAGVWSQRQRWHSAGNETQPQTEQKKLRAVRSVASLRESTRHPEGPFSDLPTVTVASVMMGRSRKISCASSDGSSCGGSSGPCWTSLAPRTGAKKFDRTRLQHLNSLAQNNPSLSPASTISSLPPVDLAPAMRDPLSLATSATPKSPSLEQKNTVDKPKFKQGGGAGLGTGPHVYDGMEIPCASIHLYSDPEDNLEPALALTMSASKLKKLKKKSHSTNTHGSDFGAATHARCASSSTSSQAGDGVAHHAKGSSRWWSNILHG
ncbi:hypothetical protein NDA16_002373 [Ustilago loliicola]|nr:hypothetical protein NDA16_002373 [Ustilago loliicola]